jgi:hypothetical protein
LTLEVTDITFGEYRWILENLLQFVRNWIEKFRNIFNFGLRIYF